MKQPTHGVLGVVTAFLLSFVVTLATMAQGYNYGSPGYYPYGSQRPLQSNKVGSHVGSVKISSPKEGAALPWDEPVVLTYEVDPGPRGDHVHVYINGREVGIVRKLKGSYFLGNLNPGRYTLAIKVVNKGHVPIGIESSVTIDIQ